jgi:hypothetical protein
MTLSHSQFHMPKKWLEHASREFIVNPSMTVVIGCHGVVSVSQAFARTRSRGEQVAEKSKAVAASPTNVAKVPHLAADRRCV